MNLKWNKTPCSINRHDTRVQHFPFMFNIVSNGTDCDWWTFKRVFLARRFKKRSSIKSTCKGISKACPDGSIQKESQQLH